MEQKNRFSDTSENKTKSAQNISLMLGWPDFLHACCLAWNEEEFCPRHWIAEPSIHGWLIDWPIDWMQCNNSVYLSLSERSGGGGSVRGLRGLELRVNAHDLWTTRGSAESRQECTKFDLQDYWDVKYGDTIWKLSMWKRSKIKKTNVNRDLQSQRAGRVAAIGDVDRNLHRLELRCGVLTEYCAKKELDQTIIFGIFGRVLIRTTKARQ
jgi:hypothetical protein